MLDVGFFKGHSTNFGASFLMVLPVCPLAIAITVPSGFTSCTNLRRGWFFAVGTIQSLVRHVSMNSLMLKFGVELGVMFDAIGCSPSSLF
jgi:hypothetical protein